MNKDYFIKTTFLVEQENTKIVKAVRISIPVKSISTYYEYPCELDNDLDCDATKVFCTDDNHFVIKMCYDEFEKEYFDKMNKINKIESIIKSN